MFDTSEVAPGFNPARAALKGGATCTDILTHYSLSLYENYPVAPCPQRSCQLLFCGGPPAFFPADQHQRLGLQNFQQALPLLSAKKNLDADIHVLLARRS